MRRSQVFAGNVTEHRTLARMLEALNAPCEALVVMDRGIATEECVRWLRENAYRYLVVSRERTRYFDPERAQRIETASRHGVCCFSLCLVESPRQFAGLFRRRIAWDDEAIREALGADAVAFVMGRRCRGGEDVGARAPSVDQWWASAQHLSRPCPHAPQDGARCAGCVHILTAWRREGCRRNLGAPSDNRGVGVAPIVRQAKLGEGGCHVEG